MFTEGAIVTLVVFASLFLRWVSDTELRQSLVDSGHDPEIAVRAARYRRRRLATDSVHEAGISEGTRPV
jgi:hypothetical protein